MLYEEPTLEMILVEENILTLSVGEDGEDNSDMGTSWDDLSL